MRIYMDDLDKDGHITNMIRKSSKGRYKKDPKDPRKLRSSKVG